MSEAQGEERHRVSFVVMEAGRGGRRQRSSAARRTARRANGSRGRASGLSISRFLSMTVGHVLSVRRLPSRGSRGRAAFALLLSSLSPLLG